MYSDKEFRREIDLGMGRWWRDMVCWLETQVIPKMTSSRIQTWVWSEEVLVSGHCPTMRVGHLSLDKSRERTQGPDAT